MCMTMQLFCHVFAKSDAVPFVSPDGLSDGLLVPGGMLPACDGQGRPGRDVQVGMLSDESKLLLQSLVAETIKNRFVQTSTGTRHLSPSAALGALGISCDNRPRRGSFYHGGTVLQRALLCELARQLGSEWMNRETARGPPYHYKWAKDLGTGLHLVGVALVVAGEGAQPDGSRQAAMVEKLQGQESPVTAPAGVAVDSAGCPGGTSASVSFGPSNSLQNKQKTQRDGRAAGRKARTTALPAAAVSTPSANERNRNPFEDCNGRVMTAQEQVGNNGAWDSPPLGAQMLSPRKTSASGATNAGEVTAVQQEPISPRSEAGGGRGPCTRGGATSTPKVNRPDPPLRTPTSAGEVTAVQQEMLPISPRSEAGEVRGPGYCTRGGATITPKVNRPDPPLRTPTSAEAWAASSRGKRIDAATKRLHDVEARHGS